MERKRGFSYTINGQEDVELFAKSILLLTNLRSNKMGVIDFRTFDGINLIQVVTDHENDDYLSNHIGNIKNKEEIMLLEAHFEDLSDELQNSIVNWQGDKEVFVSHSELNEF